MHASNPLDTNLFSAAILGSTILVSYHTPQQPLAPLAASQNTTLEIPLTPEYSNLLKVIVEFNNSSTIAYDIRQPYANWFTECFGWDCILPDLRDGHCHEHSQSGHVMGVKYIDSRWPVRLVALKTRI